MAVGLVYVEPRGSNVVKVPLGARKKPCDSKEPAAKNPPVTAPSGLMAVGKVKMEEGGSNTVKVPLRARR
jgi:hypothetical protein